MKLGGRMQKRHAKGFFINSTYRRTSALKTLLHNIGQHQDEEEDSEQPHDFSKSSFSYGNKDADLHGHKDPMKRAVGI
jgi:hypothetical protein